MDKSDTIKWIVIIAIFIIAAITTPTLFPELFKSCSNTLADIAQSAKDVGKGLQEGIPPAK